MIRKFNPPIVVYDTAVYSIDTETRKFSIICYINNSNIIDNSIVTKSLSNEARDELKIEIARRVNRVKQYLASEGYINPKDTNWEVSTGLVIGNPPKFI